jgi:hypothetical protein
VDDTERARIDRMIDNALDDIGLVYERVDEGSFLVTLEGDHKLQTMTWLTVGDHTLRIEAFFMRRPAENPAGTYAFLLGRNAKTYGVHFSIDLAGDVYLTGQLPLRAITADEIDRVLGCTRTYSDENFDPAVALGFAGAIERERAWRARVAAAEAGPRMRN